MTSLFDRVAGLFRESSRDDRRGDARETTPGRDAPPAGDRSDGPVAAVAVVLQRAPAGIRRFDLRVSVPDAAGTTVQPGLLAAHFEQSRPDDTTVRLRAVDFTGEGRTVTGAVPLASLRFEESIPPDAVSLSVTAALDHDGDSLPTEWLRLTPVEPDDDPTHG